MSCPYLGGNGDVDVCDVSGRTLSTSRASGYCETGGYVNCPNYITTGEDEEQDHDFEY